MRTKNNYFEQAENLAHENQAKFTGQYGEDYANTVGNVVGMEGGMEEVDMSSPYVVTVKNTTTVDISDVTIFDAADKINDADLGIPTGISVTYDIPNVSYKQFLHSTLNEPFNIGFTRIMASSETQARQTWEIETLNVRGKRIADSVIPVQDLYQFDSNGFNYENSYIINGYTTITINKVATGASMTFYMYPQRTISPSNALTKRPLSKEFARPNTDPALRARR